MDTLHKKPSYFGVDSEFQTTATEQKVYSFQIASGDEKRIFRTKANFVNWAEEREPKYFFAFNLLPELGSLQLMGLTDIKVWNLGIQTRASLLPTPEFKHPILMMDTQPIAQAFGLFNVEQIGKFLGMKKMPNEEDCKGCAYYPCPKTDIRWNCRKYAIRDAEIIYLFTQFCENKCKFDIRKAVSTATIADQAIGLPARLKKTKRCVFVPPLERRLREQATFAGRSEAFATGYIPKAFYNDITSLYPLSILVSECLTYSGVEKCDESDICLKGSLSNSNGGWVLGKFKSTNDIWGLPIHAGLNILYVTGEVFGLYHTWDLTASKAEIVEAYKFLRPTIGSKDCQEEYKKIFWEKLDEGTPDWLVRFDKGKLNGLSGKLGQRKPMLSRKTNFPAYSALLAKSHQLMSWFFDYIYERKGEIYGMDTDSAFSNLNLGNSLLSKIGDYPFKSTVKGSGELTFLRAKQYMWSNLEEKKYNACHGWHYSFDDYRKAISTFKKIETTKQIRRTANTRVEKARKLPLGYWYDEPVSLEADDLHRLLKADVKRKRKDYDSLKLAEEKRMLWSASWCVDEAIKHPMLKQMKRDYQPPSLKELRI